MGGFKQFYNQHPDALIGGFFTLAAVVLTWFLTRKKDSPKPNQTVNQEGNGNQSVVQNARDVKIDQSKHIYQSVHTEQLPITIKKEIELSIELSSVVHPERLTEYWDVFKVALCTTKFIQSVTVEIVGFYDEGTKTTPYGFVKGLPFPLISNQSINTKRKKKVNVVSLKKIRQLHESPDIYIGGVRSGKPDMDLWKPAIMKIDITSLDYPNEILSATIRIEYLKGDVITPKVKIIDISRS